MMTAELKIRALEHVGIRVCNAQRSMSFYKMLGFTKVLMLPEHNACEMKNSEGQRINLIFSGDTSLLHGHNVLQDADTKFPGITHIAYVIDSMSAFLSFCKRRDIKVTEGPIRIGERRVACFIRDPDGTVLEFNELEK
ncbi:Glyoxalase/Bleomycin resistance protein/Dioxygenase superfamily protein [Grimontia celer]|uniref:Glyoxalase/Bleomycin resistance protein/Dioxygenase superfamily protein n=1 Tax=Grimontia celer TaxID=1796497 RepID=A0A128F7X3_9GAMM|nr:VOC family protein [Grimontia celer]CZF82406.1 Glyoxalase/Bleomycin resistance protein/Dioxygenase superfamily protein [Grimontia celer]